MSRNVIVIPGPEAVLWWGVHVPFLAMVFGVVGILVGHWMAPVIGSPLPLQRQVAVVVGGILLSLTITMAIGQKPLLGLAWSIGIGFSGITIFQTIGRQARGGLQSLGEAALEQLRQRLDANAAAGADEDAK